MASCDKCGKPLTDPVSISIGLGPVCRMNQKQVDRERDMFNEAEFDFFITNDVLVIIDLNNGAKSVTNDMENVLEHIQQRSGIVLNRQSKIMYKDSMEIFDGVQVNDNGRFVSFYSIGVRDETEALKKITKPIKQLETDVCGQKVSGLLRYQNA